MTFKYALHAPRIDALLGALGRDSAHRKSLLETAARGVQRAVSRHIERMGTTRHRTASSLGAEPTGHYERAAADVTSEVDGNVGVVTIPIAGISRAFHEVTIRPGPGKSALTIPIAAEAYGRNVVEMRSSGWVVFRPKKSRLLFGSRDGVAGALPLYALVAVVRQPQDRTLLPSDEELGAAAEDGVQTYLREVTRA